MSKNITQIICRFLGFIVSGCLLFSCGTGRHAVSRGKKSETVTIASTQKKGKTEKKDSGNKSLKNNSVQYADYSKLVVNEAYTWLGTKYKYGGQSRSGTDCSGMVLEVYLSALEVKLPRSSAQQHDFCKLVQLSELVPGDLVFFSNDGKNVSHVGIYIGNDEMIHASLSSGVIVSNLSDPYYRSHYHSAGKVPGLVASSKTVNKDIGTVQNSSKKISGNVPPHATEVKLENLDEVLKSKSDSILSTFMD